jgi:outer membrane lipoprotein-sorting protein
MMNIVLVLLSLLATGTALTRAQEGEAQRLLGKMQNKIKSAKTIKATATIQGITPREYKVPVTLWVAEDNKARCEARTESLANIPIDILMVSNGKTVVFHTNFVKEDHPAPGELTATLIHGLADIGCGFAAMSLSLAGDANPYIQGFVTSNYALGDKEVVGGRKAQSVRYIARHPQHSRRQLQKITVWIDTETFLPLKRVVRFEEDTVSQRSEEHYLHWELDAKLGPRLFELPK